MLALRLALVEAAQRAQRTGCTVLGEVVAASRLTRLADDGVQAAARTA